MPFSMTVDINGGDAVTADADLIFKIYDDGVLHHTVGSANSDSDVSINAGIVTIANIPSISGSSYDFTVTQVDEAGNESPASNLIAAIASAGTIIYQNDFTNGIADILTANSSTYTNPNDRLRIEKVGGVANAAFSVFTSSFSPPGNWETGKTYAIEIDVSTFGSDVTDAINSTPSVGQVYESLAVGSTIRWQWTGASNGSFQIQFRKSNGLEWAATDFIELDEIRVYEVT